MQLADDGSWSIDEFERDRGRGRKDSEKETIDQCQ